MAANIGEHEAIVNITWAQQNGELPDPVLWDSDAEDIRRWATEAVRTGSVPGIDADPDVDFANYLVEPFTAKDGEPNRYYIRPKTPFG